ncbi:MAG: DNA mismatch repair protein MutS [Myxococcota bacterium]
MFLAGFLSLVLFLLFRAAQVRREAKQALLEARAAVHRRHLLRVLGRATELPSAGSAPPGHPYATDIDLVGPGSLCQRIDVSHTVVGERILSRWLRAAADRETIRARQEAVRELAGLGAFRESLEAHGAIASGDERLDPAPFLAFTRRPPLVTPALRILCLLFPVVTLAAFALGPLLHIPAVVAYALLALQSGLAFRYGSRAIEVFQLIAARRGYIEALKGMLVTAHDAKFESALLQSVHARLAAGGQSPAAYMARLDRWAGFAEFHTQFPVHFVVNLAVLWDLNVLARLEAWNRDVGAQLEDAFEALGELEALTSLATLLHGDGGTSFPELHEGALEAKNLAHPLLAESQRVANDVAFPEQGVLIVTGSNMAGKSTLLRSLGLNIALALAGGPVVASELRLPLVRLRASMRVDDSLQKGASYFHAELAKLRSVVAGAENEPPVFFLLDELLRGTNARARHIGARAVIQHLMIRGASGITATHDISLAKMEDEQPERIRNVHFTDVMEDGEMIFDYALREGVVRTSNALRLLELAGVDVEVDDRLTDESA